MIPTKKLSPLSFGYRVTSRAPRNLELVVVLRGKFRLAPGGPMEFARAGVEKFLDKDVLEGHAADRVDEVSLTIGQGSLTGDLIDGDDDFAVGQLAYPSDFAEHKPRTDVMARGSCYPRGSAHPSGSATECMVGFGVGEFYKELKVVGPRVWVDKILGGKHTDPKAFSRCVIDYKHAFGGPNTPQNPVGTGAESEMLPNIEPAKGGMAVAGFGPINPEWQLRRHKRGLKYDEKWEKEREPWYAEDYDWTAQNAAPADQQLEGYLRGDEELRFLHMHPDHKELRATLPGIRPRAFVMLTDESMKEVHVNLDTLFADVDEGVVYLTWRGHAPVKEDDLSDVKHLLIAHEMLADAKTPGTHYKKQLRAFADDPYGLEDNPASALAELEEKAQSGELEREIADMEADDALVAILGPLTEKLEGGAEMLGQLKDAAKETLKKAGPGGGGRVKDALLALIKQGTDGAAAPRMVVNDKGKPSMGPMMQRAMRPALQASEQAGANLDMDDVRDDLKESVAALGADDLDPDDFDVPTSLEPPEPAPGADFTACDLTGQDWSGKDLSGCNFESANLTQMNFEGAKLTGSSFRGAAMTRVHFKGADCTECDFSQSHLVKTSLKECDLTKASFDQTTMQKCSLANAKLDGVTATMAQFLSCKIVGTEATKAVFDKCIFNECNMLGARFDDTNLQKSFFRDCDLTKARFVRADLSNGGFFECKLDKAQLWCAKGELLNFQGSTLRQTDLRHADMPAASFSGVPANGADFSAANMPKARFYRAVLRKAKIAKANLIQADMRKIVVSDCDFRGSNCYQAAFIEAHGVDADFRNANLLQANFKRSELVKKS